MAEYNITTIFGEKVNIGDEIMYMTVRHNDIIYSFATVNDIEPYIDRAFADPQRWRLRVHRFGEINWRGYEEKDQLIHLTNPRIIKLNKVLRSPGERNEHKRNQI